MLDGSSGACFYERVSLRRNRLGCRTAQVFSNPTQDRKSKQMASTKADNSKVARFSSSLIGCFGTIIVLALSAACVAAADAKAEAADNKLVGTWTLISAKYGGQEFKPEQGMTTIKHITPTQFMWASYGKDGKVTRAAGGNYTLKGDAYEETPEYGISGDFDIIKGNIQAFTCKIEGNKWYHNGKLSNGLTIEEIWERVEKKK